MNMAPLSGGAPVAEAFTFVAVHAGGATGAVCAPETAGKNVVKGVE